MDELESKKLMAPSEGSRNKLVLCLKFILSYTYCLLRDQDSVFS